MKAEDPYLPLRALAAYSGLSVRTLRGYLTHMSHPLPHFRIGGKIMVRRSDYDLWASRFRVEGSNVSDAIVSEILSGF